MVAISRQTPVGERSISSSPMKQCFVAEASPIEIVPLPKKFQPLGFPLPIVARPSAKFLLAEAELKPIVAVVPFKGEGVSPALLRRLEVVLRAELGAVGGYELVAQTHQEEVLKQQAESLKDCYDEACALRIGHMVSARQVVRGEITKIGKQYLVAIHMIDLERGTTHNSVTEVCDCSDEAQFVGVIRRLAQKMVGRTQDDSLAIPEFAKDLYDFDDDRFKAALARIGGVRSQ